MAFAENGGTADPAKRGEKDPKSAIAVVATAAAAEQEDAGTLDTDTTTTTTATTATTTADTEKTKTSTTASQAVQQDSADTKMARLNGHGVSPSAAAADDAADTTAAVTVVGKTTEKDMTPPAPPPSQAFQATAATAVKHSIPTTTVSPVAINVTAASASSTTVADAYGAAAPDMIETNSRDAAANGVMDAKITSAPTAVAFPVSLSMQISVSVPTGVTPTPQTAVVQVRSTQSAHQDEQQRQVLHDR